MRSPENLCRTALCS